MMEASEVPAGQPPTCGRKATRRNPLKYMGRDYCLIIHPSGTTENCQYNTMLKSQGEVNSFNRNRRYGHKNSAIACQVELFPVCVEHVFGFIENRMIEMAAIGAPVLRKYGSRAGEKVVFVTALK